MSSSSLPSFIKIHPAVLEKKSKMWKVYRRTDDDGRTDDGRCAMTIAHSSLRLRWAKKVLHLKFKVWRVPTNQQDDIKSNCCPLWSLMFCFFSSSKWIFFIFSAGHLVQHSNIFCWICIKNVRLTNYIELHILLSKYWYIAMMWVHKNWSGPLNFKNKRPIWPQRFSSKCTPGVSDNVKHFKYLCTPLKKAGHIVLHMAVCRSP